MMFFLDESQHQIIKPRQFQLQLGIRREFHLDLCRWREPRPETGSAGHTWGELHQPRPRSSKTQPCFYSQPCSAKPLSASRKPSRAAKGEQRQQIPHPLEVGTRHGLLWRGCRGAWPQHSTRAWHTWGTLFLALLAVFGTPGWFWHSWLMFTPTPSAAPAPATAATGLTLLRNSAPRKLRVFSTGRKRSLPLGKVLVFSVLNRQSWISPRAYMA